MRRAGRGLLALLVWLLPACGREAPTGPDPGSGMPGRFEYNGLTHVSWWHDEYLSGEAAAARVHLVDTGGNWAAVLVTWYMDRADSNTIVPDTLRTPSDAAVRRAVEDLRARGLKVMLKPHVDVQDGTWRGAIRPRDTGAWFASYAEFILRYAALAQASGVEMFCVGTELATLSDSRRRADWEAVLAAVRRTYGGPLTYAANATSPGDEFTSVSFWDRLDVAGLDAYAPLTDRTDPSRSELAAAWSRNRHGHNMVAAFRNWQGSHGKPAMMTEIGYRSADGANRAPFDFTAAAGPDPGEQADCYAALYEVWLRESSWMRGVFWWNWAVPTPGPADTDYTPRGKPAEAVLRQGQRPS